MPKNVVVTDDIHELYDECTAIVENPKRIARVEQWKKELAFYFNAQWEKEESDDLEATGQVDVVLNTIRRATRTLLSQMVSDNPTAKFMPRDVIPSDSSNTDERQSKLTTIDELQGLWDHCWYTSNGSIVLRRAVQFQLMCGLGWIQVRKNPKADYYRGEIEFVDHLPWEVVVPINATKMNFDDAHRMFLRTVITVPEAVRRIGEEWREDIIRNATMSTNVEDFDTSMLAPDETEVHGSKQYDNDEEGENGDNLIVEWIECEEKVQVPAVLYRIVTDLGNVIPFVHLKQDGDSGADNIKSKLAENGITNYQLFSEDIEVDRIKRTTFIGRDLRISEETLPTDRYTNIPIINEDTYNPLAVGEVFFVAPMQKLLNKTFSLAVLHLQSSGSGDKLTGFKGAFGETAADIEAFQRLYADPRSVNELAIDYTEGSNINNLILRSPATPLQPAAVQLIQLLTAWIDRIYGINPLNWGDPTNAPRTSTATLSLLNRGDVNSKLPIMNMQYALQQAGERWLDLALNHYQFPKTVSVPDHNGIMKQYSFNQPNPNGDRALNQISDIRANIFITSGASLMVDRYSMLMLFKDLIPLNPVFAKMFLLYSDIPEKADIIGEIDHVAQLEQQLAELAPMVEELQKQLAAKDTQLQSATTKQLLMRVSSTLKQVETKYRERLKTDAMKADYEHRTALERERNQQSSSSE